MCLQQLHVPNVYVASNMSYRKVIVKVRLDTTRDSVVRRPDMRGTLSCLEVKCQGTIFQGECEWFCGQVCVVRIDRSATAREPSRVSSTRRPPSHLCDDCFSVLARGFCIYRVVQKWEPVSFSPLTLSNLHQFAQFFYCLKDEEILTITM